MNWLKDIKESLIHLAFPQVCEGCGTNVLSSNHLLCLKCLSSLPQTNFHLHSNNPIERMFWGRLPLTVATSQYFFTKESMMQQLMHQFKYRRNKELGKYLGRLMGQALNGSNRYQDVDVIVPLPLFALKERKRGFNQATILCEGITEIFPRPLLKNTVRRVVHTESQTKKNRVDRWLNMEGRFELQDVTSLTGKHVLLVDDVVTTGATLEACGIELLKAPGSRLSVATLCFSSH